MNFQHSDMEKYIDILQNCISRMAHNSAQCKTWCLTLSAALIALSINTNCSKGFSWLVLLPLVVFWFLDTYYLQLEIAFRDIYNSFIEECKNMSGAQIPETVYQIKIKRSFWRFFVLMCSTSTLPFYGIQLTVLIVYIFKGE